MIHLAHAGGVIAVLHEHLRKGDDVGQSLSEMILQIKNSGRIWPQAGQERGTAGTAKRKLAIGMFEPHAASREPIDVGLFDQWMTVAAQVVVHVVHRNEQ